jgi:ankyrin repeat protein
VTFAIIFKNEFLSIADMIEILQHMLVRATVQDPSASYVIIQFFIAFLKDYHSYLQENRPLLNQQGVNLTIPPQMAGELSRTLLQEAINSRNSLVIRFLLAQGADPNLTIEESLRPITIAAQSGQGDIVQDLITHGARVQPQEHYTMPFYDPLFIAAQSGNEAMVQFLLVAKANINKTFNTRDWGYGTLLDQVMAMIEKEPYNIESLQQAFRILRKYGAKSIHELKQQCAIKP